MVNGNGVVNNGSAHRAVPSTSQGAPAAHVFNPPDGDPIERCVKTLERLHLQQGDPVLFGKDNVVKGTLMAGEAEVPLYANAFGLKTTNLLFYQYHVDLNKVLIRGQRAGVPLLMNPEDNNGRRETDFSKYQKRQTNRKLLDAFMLKYPAVFVNGPSHFCYDQAATLFSLTELSGLDAEMELTEEETHKLIDRPFKVVLVLKKPEDHALNVRDWKKNMSNDLSDETSNNIIRFLELATSHLALQHPEDHVMYESKTTYFMEPEKYGFSSPDLGNGKYLSAGASKAVVRIEGPANKGSTAVVVDSKKTPFYQSMNLLEMICTVFQIGPNASLHGQQRLTVGKYIKGLECLPTYGNRQTTPVLLFSLSEHDARSTKMEQGGVEVSIAQYFLQKYGITLKYPHLPLAVGAKRVQKERPFYPLELLHVADYQRVGNNNITSADIATIVKACAVPPAIKTGEVIQCHQAYAFDADNFLKNASLTVLDKPMEIKSRVITAPQVLYANGSLNPEGNGKWRLPRPAVYIRCVQLGIWCAVYLKVPNERMSFGEFKQFVERFFDECLKRGIDIKPPAEIFEIPCDQGSIEDAFKYVHGHKCEYLLFGHSDRDTSMHSVIKGMERKYQVISQCVKTKTIFNVLKKSPLSLENIVAKTNVKLGGLNYNIALNNYPIDGNVLFIGLAMNHPAGGMGSAEQAGGNANATPVTVKRGNGVRDSFNPANVSILGFAANDGVNPNEFIGNFYFQPMHRDENIGVLDKLLEEILQRFQKNRKCPPSRVIFYRSGCADGQFGYVLRYEVPIINAVIKKYAPGAPISVIVPSKMHSFRFFSKQINDRARSDEQNIRPGTVIDGAVVSNACCEFFLNSHLAIQGSAKTPKYAIIHHTEKDVQLDMFQRWTNALCYDFQIVTSPTSLPAPVYVATRYAERGRQIYNTFESSIDANLPVDKNGQRGNGQAGQHGAGGVQTGSGGNNGTGGRDGKNGDPAENDYYKKSVEFNFTKQDYLRDKRINA